MMDRMHRPLLAGWLLLLLLLIPARGDAQVVVTEESLASTADAGLAYARAGIATAGLKLAAAEAERRAAEARTAESLARANRGAPAVPPPPVAPPPAAQTVDAGRSTVPSSTSATSDGTAPAAAATAPAGPVTEVLRARAAQGSGAGIQGSGASRADGIQGTGAPEAGRPEAPLADDATGPMEPPPAAAAMAQTPVQGEVGPGTPAADRQEIPSQNAVELVNWTTGLAGVASVKATRWATLFGDAVNQHPGLMPALLLLMGAVGTAVLALGAGIRPWRRRRPADGASQGRGVEGGESPRPLRMRQEVRVPRDVEAVLASLELRSGRPLRATRPGDPHGSLATVTRRQA